MKTFHILWMNQNVFALLWRPEKNLMKKTFFIEISDSKFKFFMGIWRSLNPSSCLLLACNWLKYDYGTFSIKEHKKFLLKQKFSSKFLTQIWHFPWSHYEKSSLRANFECQKLFFGTLNQKSASTVLSGLIFSTDEVPTTW